MIKYVNITGALKKVSEANISPTDRSFRYGDGCFETMKLVNGKVLLLDLHMKRLFASLEQLQFNLPCYFNYSFVQESILKLADVNDLREGRMRLTISRGNGSLYELDDPQLNFVIEQYPINKDYKILNAEGLQAIIYRDAVKPADRFSTIKSNNFLCYVMAAVSARKQKMDDAFLLNQDGRLTDSTIANVFIIKDGYIKTPALTEGCIAGVMRQYLLTKLRHDDFPLEEGKITVDDILNASEVFLTNAIRGIQWVKQLEQSQYTNDLSTTLHQKYIVPLFNS